jgi:hypothetical protein
VIKKARLYCGEGHLLLAFLFDDEQQTEAWALLQLGLLTGSFEPQAPYQKGCPVCSSVTITHRISEPRASATRLPPPPPRGPDFAE